MADNRTIEYKFAEADIYALIAATASAAVFSALGYLTTWGRGTYARMEVYLNVRDEEISASYFKIGNTTNKPDFVIGAVWHADTGHFSFHS